MSNGYGGQYNQFGGMAEQRLPSPSRGVMGGNGGFYGTPMVPQGFDPQQGITALPDYMPQQNGGLMSNPGFIPGPSVPQLTDYNNTAPANPGRIPGPSLPQLMDYNNYAPQAQAAPVMPFTGVDLAMKKR